MAFARGSWSCQTDDVVRPIRDLNQSRALEIQSEPSKIDIEAGNLETFRDFSVLYTDTTLARLDITDTRFPAMLGPRVCDCLAILLFLVLAHGAVQVATDTIHIKEVAIPRFFGAAANTTFLFVDKNYTRLAETQVRFLRLYTKG